MLSILSAFLAIVLGGLGRRIAGGVLNQWAGLSGEGDARVMGDHPARLIFGATVAFSAFLGGCPWKLALILIPCVWVGTTTGNFESMAMGRGSHSKYHDWLGMTAHAVLSAILPALAVFLIYPALPWWWIGLLPLLAAPGYELGWFISELTGNSPSLRQNIYYNHIPNGFKGGTELGEFFFGGACALGAFLTFVSQP